MTKRTAKNAAPTANDTGGTSAAARKAPYLHALHRSSGHRLAGVVVADLAAPHRGRADLGIGLLDVARGDLAQNPYEDPMGYVDGSRPEEKSTGATATAGSSIRRWRPPRPDRRPEPVIEPPVSSIRWEMLREGIEDYEYLWLLNDLIAKKAASLTAAEGTQYESLLKVPETITRDMTTFTTDPRPIYARRAAVAAAIEQLGR